MADLVLTTELIKDFDRIRNKPIQKGGFVFPLIASITEVMMKAVVSIGGFFFNIKEWLFNIQTRKTYIDTETGQEKSKFSLGWVEGEGNVWKFLWFCVKTSLYLVIFALGGFWFTLLGIVYVYSKLVGKFSEMQGSGSNEN